jgi:hypothetical protein
MYLFFIVFETSNPQRYDSVDKAVSALEDSEAVEALVKSLDAIGAAIQVKTYYSLAFDVLSGHSVFPL